MAHLEPQQVDLDEKPANPEHQEIYAHASSDYELKKSRFDDLSIPRTLWVFRKTALVVLSVYTGFVCEGFELGAGGSIIANQGFITEFGDGGTNGNVRDLDPTWVSSWSAMLNVGQMITFLYISRFAERFGRKKSFYLAWVWLVAGLIILNTAKTPGVWAIAKLCNGAGIGILQIVCLIYVMEIAPNRIRGGLMIFQAVWGNIGGIIVSLMMQQLNKTRPNDYLLAMRILWIPIGLMILFYIWIPESPWYHARRGEKEAALKSLKSLYGGVKGYDFEEEYSIIERTIVHEKAVLAHEPTYMDCFRGVDLKRTLTIMLLSACTQLGGLSIVNTYSTYFFSLAGLADPFLGSLILSCVNLLAITLWALTTDKFGRRTILLTCQTMLVVILFTVGGLHYTGATTGNAKAGTALLAISCLWGAAFSVISMSQYVYMAELPSSLLRLRTGPVTFVVNSILGIATVYATPPMLLNLSLLTGFVYGAFSVPVCICMWLFIPETKGRSTAEIDELYERKVPAWQWASTVTTVEEDMQAAVGVRPVGKVSESAVM